jgi:apolipoprotein N-acyltransferase
MHPDLQISLHTAEFYAQEIGLLASQGAKIIVFPEKGINLSKESDSLVVELLKRSALQNHVTVVVGYSNFKTANTRNSSIVINDEGLVAEDYDKIHLVTGFEDQFMKGSKIGLFKFSGIQAGTAVCKDLDFPSDIRKYGKSEVSVLCIPAWDFVVDDWLHSRMAILRGVENGFSEIRTARLGRLSISDPYGKVNAEAKSTNGKAKSLVGLVSLERIDTVYTRYGDWFGLVVMFTALAFLLLIMFKKKALNVKN